MNPENPNIQETHSPRRGIAKWKIAVAVVVVLLILPILISLIGHHKKSPAAGHNGIVYQKTGTVGAATPVGQPIKVGDYDYINACNVLPLSTIAKQLGGPGSNNVGNATYADATTAPAYTSDDGIEAECAYDNLGDGQRNYQLSLVEALSPEMAKATQHIDKATIAKMEPVPGLTDAHYGFTHRNGDGVYGLIDNIYYKLSVADLRNATSGGQTTDPQFKAAIIGLAKQLEANIKEHKTGDSRAASTATQAKVGSVSVINNPCEIFSTQNFANGLKHNTYIPSTNRIPSPNDIKSTFGINVAGGTAQDRYMSTCARTTADTTNYGKERAGSADLSQALQNFTQPQGLAKATITVSIASYGSAAAAAQEMAGTVYMQAEGAQPVSGYGHSAVYIPVASLSSTDHVSQLSVQKGPYIVDFVYAADQSLDIANNKTATINDYVPFIAPLLAKLPQSSR